MAHNIDMRNGKANIAFLGSRNDIWHRLGQEMTALNAITRYVDHDKATRGGESPEEARVLSANFGSGAALKAKAIGLLMPDLRQPVMVAA